MDALLKKLIGGGLPPGDIPAIMFINTPQEVPDGAYLPGLWQHRFPKAPGVGQAMADYIDQVGVNIGRGGYEAAYHTAEVVLDTRERLCRLFGWNARECDFHERRHRVAEHIAQGLSAVR